MCNIIISLTSTILRSGAISIIQCLQRYSEDMFYLFDRFDPPLLCCMLPLFSDLEKVSRLNHPYSSAKDVSQ